MTAYWTKAVRDFWQERTRTVLVVLAIAVGIAAFSTVMSTYAILVRELDRGYLATNPASAVLRTDAVDDALVAALRADPRIAQAEARRVVTGRIKAGPVLWRNLTLFVVKDYGDIRVSRLVPQQGAWPPAPGEILIERDALQVAKTRIGADVTLKTARGAEHSLRVSGSVHDVGQAQARMENGVYGYITLETLARLDEEPYLDQIGFVVAERPFDEAHVKQVAADVKAWLEARGHPVRRVDVPTPGKHPHGDLMGLLLLAQAAFGLFALLLSGILVVNLLTALMAAQVRQIGVMKALGGTRAQIARLYLGQALFLGGAALALAVPAGIWGSRVFCRQMAVFLNFDITSFQVPLWVYGLDALVGILVPLLAAAYPVAKGSGVSVRAALQDFGIAQTAFGADGFDRMLAGVSGLTRPVLFALRNGARRRARLFMTVGTLATSGLFFLSALNVRSSMIRTLDRLFGQAQYELTVGLAGMYPVDALQRAVGRTPGVRRAESWITTEAALPRTADGSAGAAPEHALHAAADAGERFAVVALPAATELLKPEIVEGRGLRPGDVDVVVINGGLAARAPELKLGGAAALRLGPGVVSLRVVGRAHEPFTPPTAYIPLEFFEAQGHRGTANSLRLVLERNDDAAVQAVRARLEAELQKEGLRALNSSSKTERRYGFDQHMLMIYVFLVVMSCILAGVGGLGLMTTMSLNVLERRRELGVLRAIGATPRAVFWIVASEALAIALASFVLAAVLAWPISKALGELLLERMFRITPAFAFEPMGLVVWLAVSLNLGAIASLAPAWQASRRPIREAISYE
jgi:putative ABC transport system permease protein